MLVTDIFKKLWPNWINAIVKRGVGEQSWQQLDVRARTRKLDGINSQETKFLEVSDWHGWNGKIPNSEGLEILPQSEKIIPEAVPEKRIEEHFEPGWSSEQFRIPMKYEGGKHTDADAMAKQLLGHWAFNGIVIPREPRAVRKELLPEEALRLIIEIQNRVLPKGEQIPVYDDAGRCLYNPLK